MCKTFIITLNSPTNLCRKCKVKIRDDVKYFIINGKLTPLEDFPFSFYHNRRSVYEVIRYDGNYLFKDSHLKRLQNSFRIAFPRSSFNPLPSDGDLIKIIEKNNISKGNVRIEVFEEIKTILVFLIPHFYPPAGYYEQGVDTVFQFDERPLKNAKLFAPRIRERANEIIAREGVFETILVNSAGYITEGSRSNVFFIAGDKVITPPDNQVLPGITRNNVIKFLETNDISLEFRKISKDEIEMFDSMFLTGTSIGALPCRRLQSRQFDLKNPLLGKIIDGFN